MDILPGAPMAITTASDRLKLSQAAMFAVSARRAARIPFASRATEGRSACEHSKGCIAVMNPISRREIGFINNGWGAAPLNCSKHANGSVLVRILA